MTPIRLLILGTGGMASSHAAAFSLMDDVKIVAGVDTNAANLAEFCKKFDMPNQFLSLPDALAWGAFDAVCNVTPDAVHYPTTMPLLAAGKHVLCEKPLATNFADAQAMTDAATSAGVINMVNLTYRNVAALQKARQIVADGQLGTIRHFEASYLQSWLTQPAWGDWRTEKKWLWRLSSDHGSWGALGDIGIHVVDFATYAAGSDVREVSGRLQTFHKAEGDQIGDYKLDANDAFTMQVQLGNGAVGVIHASRFASGHHNDLSLRIHGDKGGLLVVNKDGVETLRGCLGKDMETGVWTDIPTDPVPMVYDRFIGAIRGEHPAEPDFARAAALQKVLDLVIASDGDGSRRQTV